jgi:hypothetical protein
LDEYETIAHNYDTTERLNESIEKAQLYLNNEADGNLEKRTSEEVIRHTNGTPDDEYDPHGQLYDRVYYSKDNKRNEKETTASVAGVLSPLSNVISSKSTKDIYETGDTWTVPGQWELTIDSVSEMSERNQFSEKNPGAVYLVDYHYKNIGYREEGWDGVYISIDDTIVDSAGKMGYSYPNSVNKYAQETPVGATCDAQGVVGVDNPGPFQLTVSKYDGNGVRQSAVFHVSL